MEPGPPLHLAYLADPASIHTQRWLGFFAERGHRVSLLVGDRDEIGRGLDPRIQVHRYRRFAPWRVPFLSSLQGRSGLRELLRQLQPDVLHAHYLSRYGWQARLSGYRPYIVTPWGSDLLVTPNRSRRARLWARAALGGADLVTVHSEQLQAEAIRLGANEDRIARVQFGVDTTRFTPGLPAIARLAAMGIGRGHLVFSPRSPRPNYRQDLVVEAMAALPADAVVVMPGGAADPGVLDTLRARAAELGVAGRLLVVPHIGSEDMLSLYRAATVVVSVPDSDGLPVTLLEAMGCSVPVVATDLPGAREALGPAGSRWLIPRGNASALARAVNEVLSLPNDERRVLGEALRRRAEKEFDFTQSMLRMEGIYRSLARPAT